MYLKAPSTTLARTAGLYTNKNCGLYFSEPILILVILIDYISLFYNFRKGKQTYSNLTVKPAGHFPSLYPDFYVKHTQKKYLLNATRFFNDDLKKKNVLPGIHKDTGHPTCLVQLSVKNK